jgi:hypothetical protein
MAELTNMVERLPFTLFISAIDKQQHLLRSGPADDEPYGLALKLRPIFLYAPRITFQPLALSLSPPSPRAIPTTRSWQASST